MPLHAVYSDMTVNDIRCIGDSAFICGTMYNGQCHYAAAAHDTVL